MAEKSAQNETARGENPTPDHSSHEAREEQHEAAEEANDSPEEQVKPQTSPPATETLVRKATPEESKKELQEAIAGSNEVLATATSVMPLFPDTLTVDRAKLTITKRTFFRSANIMSMRIEDVLNTDCTLGLLFGHVKITSRVLNDEQSSTVGPFWRNDAARLKRITQGYVIALQRNIDCSALETKELADMLDKLGMDEHPSL